MKRLPEDINLRKCTISDNHIMYGSWDIEHDGQNFWSCWTIFCPFTPLTTQKIKILKKWKKHLEYYHLLYLCTINGKSYDPWFLRYEPWQTEFFCHFGPFFALIPTNNLKIQNFGKLIKAPGSIIILHKCTKNHDHVLYCSWDMAHNGCNCYLSFWAIFCPFTSLTAGKIKIKKRWKKKTTPGDIILLKCTKNYGQML